MLCPSFVPVWSCVYSNVYTCHIYTCTTPSYPPVLCRRVATVQGGGGGVNVGSDETYVSMEVCTNILHEARESVRRASSVSPPSSDISLPSPLTRGRVS